MNTQETIIQLKEEGVETEGNGEYAGIPDDSSGAKPSLI